MATVLDADAMAAIELVFALRSVVQGLDNVFTRWLEKDALTPGRWQVLVTLTPKGRKTTLRLLHENTQLLQKIFRNIKSDMRKFENILSKIDLDANP